MNACTATGVAGGVTWALCGGTALASFLTLGAASPALIACTAGASAIGSASAACRGIADAHNLKRDLGPSNGTSLRKNKNGESEICFDILEDMILGNDASPP